MSAKPRLTWTRTTPEPSRDCVRMLLPAGFWDGYLVSARRVRDVVHAPALGVTWRRERRKCEEKPSLVKTRWGELVQRNKMLIAFGLAKEQQGHKSPGIRGNSFSERVKRLAWGVMESPSLEGSRNSLDVALGDTVAVLVFRDLRGLFQTPINGSISSLSCTKQAPRFRWDLPPALSQTSNLLDSLPLPNTIPSLPKDFKVFFPPP